VPASIKDDAEAGTTKSDVCGIKDVAPILNWDACDVVAFGKMNSISGKTTKRDYDRRSEMYKTEEGYKTESTHGGFERTAMRISFFTFIHFSPKLHNSKECTHDPRISQHP
jgi:hypothetical protein